MKYKKLITLILIFILSIGNIKLSTLTSAKEAISTDIESIPQVYDLDSSSLTVHPNPIMGKYHYIQDVITGTGSYFSEHNSFLYCTDDSGNTMMCYCTEPTRPAPTTSTEYSDYYLEDINSEEGIKQAKTLPILTYGFGANEASCNSFLNNYPENPQQGGSFGYYAVDGVITRGLLINGVLFPMSSSEAYGLTAALVHKVNGADVGTVTGSVIENGFTSSTEVAAAATYLENISTWTYERGVAGGSIWHAADALNSLNRGEHIFSATINHPKSGWIPLPDTSTVTDWSPYSISGKIYIKISYESKYMESQLLSSSQSGSEEHIVFTHENLTTVDFDSTKNGYYDYFRITSNPENQVDVSVTYGSLKNNYFTVDDIPCSSHSGISFCQDATIALDLNQLNEGKYLSLSITTGNGSCKTDAYGDGDQDGVYSLGVRYFQTPNYQNVAVSSPNSTISYTSTYLYMSNKFGKIILEKSSSNPDITNNNPNYSLDGAIYSIYKSKEDAESEKNSCGQIIIDKQGKGSSSNLNIGTYYVKETKAPLGYALDHSIYTVSVTSSEVTVVAIEETPQLNIIDILLTKTDNFDVPLANAEFTIRYYSTISDDPARDELTPTRIWTVKTDKNGISKLSPDYLVSGDEFYYSSDNKIGIPLGTITIEETKAPNGYYENDTFKEWTYTKSDNIYIQQITSSGNSETLNVFAVPTIVNQKEPYKAYLKIIKKDETTGNTIINNTATFKIWSYSSEKYICEAKTNQEGILITPSYLPEGKYRIEETENPTGYYTSNSASKYDIEISEDNATEKYVTPEGEETLIDVCEIEIENSPLSGQIIINKKGEYQEWNQETVTFDLKTHPLENIQFDVYAYENIYSSDGHGDIIYSSGTLIESIFTDSNGCAKTSDTLPLGKYEIKENTPNIYFPEDSIIIELSSENNTIETLTGNTSRKLVVYSVDILNKLKIPAITTYATNEETNDKYCPTKENTKIIDKVSYENLIPGTEYTIYGKLMNKSTKQKVYIDNTEVSSSLTFTPEDSSGFIDVSFQFNSSEFGNIDIVVFEEIYCDGKLIACHNDYDCEEQTLHFISPVINPGIPEEPKIPDEPATTEIPILPEIPENPDYPEVPLEPNAPTIPDSPKTGDSSSLGYILILLILSGVLIFVFLFKSSHINLSHNKHHKIFNKKI